MISFVNGEYSFRNIIDHAKKYKPASGFSKRFVQITHMSEQRYTSLYEIKLKDALEQLYASLKYAKEKFKSTLD